MIMLNDLYLFYSQNILAIVIVEDLIAATFFAYFFILRKKSAYCKFYWQGFFLMGIGVSITLVQELFFVGSWELNVVKLPFLLVGFILVILGVKKHREEKARLIGRKNE